MQKANCIVRLGGDITNTVPKLGVTPAEILILRHIHGDDAVVDIRPTEFDEKIRNEREVTRLAKFYDSGSSFAAEPGAERKSIIETLFPGAMKKLPLTLEEIGIDSGAAASQPAPTIAPDIAEVDEDDDAEPSEPEDGEGDGEDQAEKQGGGASGNAGE